MNAVGLAEQESGRALGFFCSTCGRSQLPDFCQNPVDAPHLTELHRKAEACCTTAVCEKHNYQLYGWELCPFCVMAGPTPPLSEAQRKIIGDHVRNEIDAGLNITVTKSPRRPRHRKAAAK